MPPAPAARERLVLAGLLAVAAGLFLIGITWGLPSRAADPFLFGHRAPWTGAQVQRLTASAQTSAWDDPTRGADVDADPLGAAANEPVVVNATDPQRAQIVRRYRLFTHQPDEMLTLMALAKMRPGRLDLDPRMYQYGGLWFYPIGAILKIASLAGLVELRGGPDALAFYIDHPEKFGRFYVAARLYVAAWGLVGVWAVFRIVRRLTPGLCVAAAGALLFACMPVVVNMAHEAKPHLPGVVLVLLATLAATRYAETGSRRAWWAAGVLCGAAFGMVLSMWPAFALLPAMTLFRPAAWRGRLRAAAGAVLVGVAVYCVTNPYVPYHLLGLGKGEALRSNVSNLRGTRAIFGAGRPLEGVWNAGVLLADGMTPLLAVAGLAGAVLLGVRAVRVRGDTSNDARRRRVTGLLLALPAVIVAAQFVPLATAKGGEFGRFLLLTEVFLAIEAVVAVATFVPGAKVRVAVLATLVAVTAMAGVTLLTRFVDDARGVTTRLRVARQLQGLVGRGDVKGVYVTADPAPYGMPPVDLFLCEVAKLPAGADAPDQLGAGDVFVRPLDAPGEDAGWIRRLFPARVSWAAKPFEVRR